MKDLHMFQTSLFTDTPVTCPMFRGCSLRTNIKSKATRKEQTTGLLTRLFFKILEALQLDRCVGILKCLPTVLALLLDQP